MNSIISTCKRSFGCTCCIALTSFLCASIANAETRNDEISIVDDTPKGVSSPEKKTGEKIDDAPEDSEEDLTVGTVAVEIPDVRSNQSISGKALDDTSGLSLGQALETVTGVRSIESGTSAKPMIHGIFGSRLLILFDGIKHESQSWGVEHAPEIDPNAAGRLTVIKGAGGVRYGSSAIGGVILVDPLKIPVEPKTVGSISLVGNTNNRSLAGSATARGRLSDLEPLGWRLQSSYKKAGAGLTPDYVLDNTGQEEFNLSGALHWDKPSYNLQLGATRFHTKLGIFTGQVAENNNQFKDLIASDRPLGVDAYTFEFDIERPYQEVDHTLVYTRLAFDLASVRTSIELSHQINERLEFDIVRRSVEGPQLNFDLRTTSGKAVAEFDAMDMIFGGVGIEGGVQENVYRGVRLIPNYRTFSGGIFGWTQFVFDKWEAEIGARLDIQDVNTFQRQRGSATAGVNEFEASYLTPSFVAGVLWLPSDSWHSKLTFAAASRAPTVNELYIDGVSQGLAGFEKGDQDLSVENAYSISADTNLAPTKWFSAHATVYGKYIVDYINLSPKLNDAGEPALTPTINGSFPSFEWNQVDTLFYGADGEIELSPLDWLEFRSTASVVFARDISNDSFLTLIPAPSFEQEIRATQAKSGPFRNTYVSAKSVLNLKQTRFESNADFAEPPDAYHLIHFGVGTQWRASKESVLNIDVDVKNLLNTKYRNYLSRLRYFADEPGRAIFLRMKLTL